MLATANLATAFVRDAPAHATRPEGLEAWDEV